MLTGQGQAVAPTIEGWYLQSTGFIVFSFLVSIVEIALVANTVYYNSHTVLHTVYMARGRLPQGQRRHKTVVYTSVQGSLLQCVDNELASSRPLLK